MQADGRWELIWHLKG